MNRILLLLLLFALVPCLLKAQQVAAIDTSDIYYTTLKRYCEDRELKSTVILVEKESVFTDNIPSAIGTVKVEVIDLDNLHFNKGEIKIVFRFSMLPYKPGRHNRFDVMLTEYHVTLKSKGKDKAFGLRDCGGATMGFDFDCERQKLVPASYYLIQH
ncbi:hypothetical protein [Chitinophaga sp. Cy-1792]|uniref:hypothetical protein n=1 Tax=Chitinophaga sp. Cy-1792 TaxID=2608339 RepID=UPI001422C26B|nr:hypothetical protein [Chitinophaga sp. Cy-1792]NIG56490.1 hypothetical protein [Chitinophaga sp. Cy-1792]